MTKWSLCRAAQANAHGKGLRHRSYHRLCAVRFFRRSTRQRENVCREVLRKEHGKEAVFAVRRWGGITANK